MIMDTRFFCFFLILVSCDPHSVEENYFVKNSSHSNLQISLFKSAETINQDIFSESRINIKEVRGIGTGEFGSIAIYDSIILKSVDDKKKIKWVNPGGVGFIDVKRDLGKERYVVKDIYNRKYWVLTKMDNVETWTFIILEEDLELFE